MTVLWVLLGQSLVSSPFIIALWRYGELSDESMDRLMFDLSYQQILALQAAIRTGMCILAWFCLVKAS